MKLSKTKKIISLGIAIGVLTAVVVTPVVIVSANKNNNQTNKPNFFKKIQDKDILIAPNVSTQNQSQIEIAIKNQLQKENSLLTNDDLKKISTNLSILDVGVKTLVTLTINIDSKNWKLNIYVEKINLLKNSNIKNGTKGTIFQDSFGNLWTMGNETNLQVLRANQNKENYLNSWTGDNVNEILLKNSNITDGYSGIIFQDSFKNLWTNGYKTPLQVLRANSSKDGYVDTGWTDINNSGLTKNSNIISGKYVKIFQDKFKNLWAMGSETPLQVLRANSSKNGYDENVGWNSDVYDGLTKNSNIIDGKEGTIFQDEFKNLWAMGSNTSFQVLEANSSKNDYVTTGWINATNSGLLKYSAIDDGQGGVIFQDKFKNLWAMGGGTKLQVLRVNNDGNDYVNTGWSNNTNSGLLKYSNIYDGQNGVIFQDKFKNLWAMGNNSKLQVLKANSSKKGYDESFGWINTTNNRLLLNSNITNGLHGTIFQDKFKNLWTMGNNTPLQVLKANMIKNDYNEIIGWTSTNDNGLLINSNITKGQGGTIFQDKFKNLWTMGFLEIKIIKKVQKTIHTKLQVLKANMNKDGYVDSW